MKYRNLGASGVKVSELCLGAMTFGEADEKSFMHKVGSDEKTSFAILNRALERASTSSTPPTSTGRTGCSERMIGAWIDRDSAATRSCSRPSSVSPWAKGPTGPAPRATGSCAAWSTA